MRRNNDQYFTPSGLTRSLLRYVPDISGSRVLEPTAGMGHISNLLTGEYSCEVVTNDIDGTMPTSYHMDATGEAFWGMVFSSPTVYDWVVTNPPYSDASEILRDSVGACRVGVAMLLRLSFLEPTKNRRGILSEIAPRLSHLIVFSPRPSFTENGRSDSVTSAWFVWQRDHTGGTRVINCTDWKDHNDYND